MSMNAAEPIQDIVDIPTVEFDGNHGPDSGSDGSDSRPGTPEDQFSLEDRVNSRYPQVMDAHVNMDEAFICGSLEGHFARISTLIKSGSAENAQDKWREQLFALADDPQTEPAKFISAPPLKKLFIELIPDLGKRHCPCCVNEVEVKDGCIDIHSGITRRDLILGIARALYGEDATEKGKGAHLHLRRKLAVDGTIEPLGVDFIKSCGEGIEYLGKRVVWIWCKGENKA